MNQIVGLNSQLKAHQNNERNEMETFYTSEITAQNIMAKKRPTRNVEAMNSMTSRNTESSRI